MSKVHYITIHNITMDNSAKRLRQKQHATHDSRQTPSITSMHMQCSLTSVVGQLQLNLESMVGCYQLK